MTTKRDLYQEITDKVIAAIEANPGRWMKPWQGSAGTMSESFPTNAVTGKTYNGVNVPMLWMAASAAGYESNKWASYDQWKSKGAQVRKGEKGTLIVFFKKLVLKDANAPEGGRDEKGKIIPLIRCWTVFNAAQVEGYVAPAPVALPAIGERLEAVDAFVASTKAIVKTGGDRAYYNAGGDYIGMPPLAAFTGTKTSGATEAYYGTLLHELTHWTGHKARCDRVFGERFGDHRYAMEELVAEMGAAFLCAKLGIASEPRPDHAQYVAHWLEVLKGDKRAIFTAASAATKAVEHVTALQPNATSGEEMEELAEAA